MVVKGIWICTMIEGGRDGVGWRMSGVDEYRSILMVAAEVVVLVEKGK